MFRRVLFGVVLCLGLAGCYYYVGSYDVYPAPYYYPGYAPYYYPGYLPYYYYYGPGYYYGGPRFYGGYRYYYWGGHGSRYYRGGYHDGHH